MEIKDKSKDEAIKLAEEKLQDLPVSEDQTEDTKAGEGRTRLIFADDQGVFLAK